MKLIILTIITTLILLLVLSLLLKDFTKFFRQMTKNIFSASDSRYYLGEVLLTWCVTFIIAFFAFLFMKAAMGISAWIFSTDLTTFFVIMRGVYTQSADLQHPVLWQHLVAGLLLTPIIQCLAILLIFESIHTFFSEMNGMYKIKIYSESDAFYFGFIAVIVLIFVDIFSFSQEANGIKNILHYVFLAISRISPLFFFFSLSHINMLNEKHYVDSWDNYIKMNSIERRMITSSKKMLIFTFLIAIILQLPFHFGLLLNASIFGLIFILLIVCAIVYLLLHRFFARGWNYLASVLLYNSTKIEDVTDNLYRIHKQRRKATYIVIAIFFILFLLIKWKIALFVAAMMILPLILSAIGLILFYLVGIIIANFRTLIEEQSLSFFDINSIKHYFFNVSIGISKALFSIYVILFLAFGLLTIFPKEFKINENFNSLSLVDKNGDILYLENDTIHSVPIEYNEIPPFFLKCLYLQEDKGFTRQNSFLPNRHNWHGVSFRGNSNINMQLIKNNAFSNKNFPFAASRKIAELPSAYQLSMDNSPENIVKWYLNIAGFHERGNGTVGLQAACYHAFGRPVTDLNFLEQLYLVRTLPLSYIKTSSGDIQYQHVQNYSEEIKTALLKKATDWYDHGLLTKKEIKKLMDDTIRFTNKKFIPQIPTATRLFIEEQLADLPKRKYISSLSKENLQRMQLAHTEYLNNPHFKPAAYKEGNQLYVAALAVNYRTGEIIGHYSNHQEDLTNFFEGYPIASTIKPFILLQLLEEDIDIQLYDGIIDHKKKTPRNGNRPYSNTYLDAAEIIPMSLNAPIVNIREVTNQEELYRNVEDRFKRMNIPLQVEFAEDTYNYSLGSRPMTVYDLGQAYQTLFNDGTYKKLTITSAVFDPQTNTTKPLPNQEQRQIYQPKNTRIIKDAMSKTVVEGTMSSVKNILPSNKMYYAKTGTTSGSKHGYSVLADDDILIVTWVTYGKVVNNKLLLGQSAIPYYAGGKSAGVFAAYIYNELTK